MRSPFCLRRRVSDFLKSYLQPTAREVAMLEDRCKAMALDADHLRELRAAAGLATPHQHGAGNGEKHGG